MADRAEVQQAIEACLGYLKYNRGQRGKFKVSDLRQLIVDQIGTDLSGYTDENIADLLKQRNDVRPAAIGKMVWQFGRPRPIKSREIRGR